MLHKRVLILYELDNAPRCVNDLFKRHGKKDMTTEIPGIISSDWLAVLTGGSR